MMIRLNNKSHLPLKKHTSTIVINRSIYKGPLNKQCCSYRMIDNLDQDDKMARKDQYEQYLQQYKNEAFRFLRRNQTIESSSSCLHSIRCQNQSCSITETQQQNEFGLKFHSFTDSTLKQEVIKSEEGDLMEQEEDREDPEEQSELYSFLMGKKNNIFKNIFLAFQSHILKCNDKDLIKQYESLLQNQDSFTKIQNRVRKQNKSRFNLKFKNLMTNEHIKKLFIYFLENIDALWLNKSRVRNKPEFQNYIRLILEAEQNNMLTRFIKFYRRSTKIISKSQEKQEKQESQESHYSYE